MPSRTALRARRSAPHAAARGGQATATESTMRLPGSLSSVPGRVQRDCVSCSSEGAQTGGGSRYELGPVDDRFEREADSIANQVVSGAATKGPMSVTHLASAGVQSQEAAPAAGDGAGADHAAAAVRSGGRPLSTSERGYFEPRFGHDFSDVRIHDGLDAAQAAQSISARAFAVDNNIAFGRGAYEPETRDGRWLMAHELSHTLQQDEGLHRKMIRRQSLSDPEELWGRARRFGARQWRRGERYAERGIDYAEHAVDSAGELGEAVQENAEGWWNRGGGGITRIDFDGSTTTVSGTTSASFRAVSGLMASNPAAGSVDYTQSEHQDVANKGPIPEGEYYVNPAEVESNPPGRFNTRAWGKYRTRLHETTGTNLSRRAWTDRTGGFYLHQDANHNGTAGCIGIWNTTDNKAIHDLIKVNMAQIPVHVDYPDPIPTPSSTEGEAFQRLQRTPALDAARTQFAGLVQRQALGATRQAQQNYLIEAGIAKIDQDLQTYGNGTFPGDYYDTLAQHLFRRALRSNGRDYGDAFSQLNDLQWGRLGAGLQRHYTAVVGTDSTNGWDKFRHFVFTAYLQYKSYGLLLPEGFTYGKEMWDEVEQFFGADPEGYSIPDIVADNRGERFGEEMAAQENRELVESIEREIARGLGAFMDPRSWGLH